jgi:hypothetical protein
MFSYILFITQCEENDTQYTVYLYKLLFIFYLDVLYYFSHYIFVLKLRYIIVQLVLSSPFNGINDGYKNIIFLSIDFYSLFFVTCIVH